MREITLALADPDFAESTAAAPGRRALRDDDASTRRTGTTRCCSRRTGPTITIAQVIADRGLAPAARRRDREVPARDVLLQRRRGGPVPGRGARARAVAARRPDLRPQARDERARGHRRVRARTGTRTTPRSRSSTSPTPTWSATPASIPAAVKAVETVDECLGRVVEAVHASGGACLDHRRPRQRRPHARARRLAQHRALAEPGAGHRHRRRRATLGGEGILADVAPTLLALLGIEQPAEMTGRSLLGLRPLHAQLARRYPLGHGSHPTARPGARPPPSWAPGAASCASTPRSRRRSTPSSRPPTALPLSSYEVLIHLRTAPGERLRMAELADRVLLSRSGMTRLVDRLEREGLLERDSCDVRRARLLRRAHRRRARQLLAEARPTHLDGVRERFLAPLRRRRAARGSRDCWERGSARAADLSRARLRNT